MADVNRDFIPEGEDPGALGSGFRDFVPAKEVAETPTEVSEEEATEEVVESEEPIAEEPGDAVEAEQESGSGKKKAN